MTMKSKIIIRQYHKFDTILGPTLGSFFFFFKKVNVLLILFSKKNWNDTFLRIIAPLQALVSSAWRR